MSITDILAILLISTGLVFFFGATVGVLRFPDVYTRMHAAGKGDTLSSLLILIGFAVYNLGHFSWDAGIVSLKVLLVSLFIFITSPTVTHALMDSGYTSGPRPWSKKFCGSKTSFPQNDELGGCGP